MKMFCFKILILSAICVTNSMANLSSYETYKMNQFSSNAQISEEQVNNLIVGNQEATDRVNLSPEQEIEIRDLAGKMFYEFQSISSKEEMNEITIKYNDLMKEILTDDQNAIVKEYVPNY